MLKDRKGIFVLIQKDESHDQSLRQCKLSVLKKFQKAQADSKSHAVSAVLWER